MKGRFFVLALVIVLVAGITLVFNPLGQNNTAPASAAIKQPANAGVAITAAPGPDDPYYVKYDGVNGESTDTGHDQWINILSAEWGVERPTAGVAGANRLRGTATPSDMTFRMSYDKAAPQLLEKCVSGAIIPRVEFEAVSANGTTYLRYELKNVLITSYSVSGDVEIGVPVVTVGNNFEEITVVYTEIKDDGSTGDIVETDWQVKSGIVTGSVDTAD